MTRGGLDFVNGVPSKQKGPMDYMEMVPYEFSTISPQGLISDRECEQGFDCIMKGTKFDRFAELGEDEVG